MRFRVRVIGLSILWGSLSTFAHDAPPHPSTLGLFPPYFSVHGSPVERPLDDNHENQCASYLLLGRGLTGIVHRIQNSENEYIGRKSFKFPEDRNSEAFLMARYHEAQENGLDTGFRIPRTWTLDRNPETGEFSGQRYLYYEDIQGRELADLLLDPTTDQRLKNWLLYDYNRRFEKWNQFIEANWPDPESTIDGPMEYFARLRQQLQQYDLASIPANLYRDRCLLFPYKWHRILIDYKHPRPYFGNNVYQRGWVLLKADNIIVQSKTLDMYLNDSQ